MNSGKKDELELIGTVREVQTGGKYIVELSSGKTVMCYLSGMARKPRANIHVGDRVRVDVVGTNDKHGRITYRYRPATDPDAEPAAGLDIEPDPPETDDRT